MSVRVSYPGPISVLETLTGAYISSADNTVTMQLGTGPLLLDGTTTPTVTKATVFAKAMIAGLGTIDLTALPGLTAEETISGDGLKVRIAIFRGKATNANPITVTFGASNPYLILGAAFSFILSPGQELQLYLASSAPTIGSGAKTIDISGTTTQVLEVGLAMGI